MSRGDRTKIGAIVLLLGAAAGIYAITGGESAADRAERSLPGDAQTLHCICMACNHEFDLSVKTYEQMRKPLEPEGGDDSEEGDEGETRTRRHSTAVSVVDCPTCGQPQAVLATQKCVEHGVYYPNVRLDGSAGTCPQCVAE